MPLFPTFSSVSGADFLEYFVYAYGNEKFSDDENAFLKLLNQLDHSPFSKIEALKDFCNNLFRQHQFDEAGGCYDTACRLLCSSLKDKTKLDLNSVLSLAVSLCLNLAACANKLRAFEEALIFCSMVLNFFPTNAKALFCKAVALKNLNRFPEASSTLEEAKLVEPHNREINHELEAIRQSLAINKNGKCVVVDSLEANEVRAEKVFVSSSQSQEVVSPPGNQDIGLVDKMDVATVCSSNFERKATDHMPYPAPLAGCAPGRSPTAVAMVSENTSAPALPSTAPDVRSSSSSTYSTSPHVNYTSKKQPHNKLQLSSQDYDKLLHGKNLGFYHPRSMSYMRVRTLTSKTIQTGTPHEEFYGSAEVPTSSPIPETQCVEFVESVQEAAFLQVDKKTRLNSNSSYVSKTSSVQFKFVAVRDHLLSREERTQDHCHAKGRKGCAKDRNGRAFATSKKRSLVSVHVSRFSCRYTNTTTTTIMRMKRKNVHLIEFDTHYHPPFKKSRLFHSVATTCTNVSSVLRVSSSFGVVNTPLFVL